VRSVNLFTTKEKKMKKKLFALSGVFLIALVIAGLWAAKAVNFIDTQNTREADPISLAMGLSMEKMTQEAAEIVIGNCIQTRSEWSGRSLVTLATISVTERLKGDGSDGTLTVVTPGGIDANRRFPVAMTYAGAPQFSLNEEVLLFLNAPVEGVNGYSVMGFSQGKFSLNTDTEGGKVVMKDMTKAPVQKGAGPTRGTPQGIPLAEFKALVRRYLNK
jgi:hypothetical protein